MSALALAVPAKRSETRAGELSLLARYHQDGDLAAREELVERLMPFAHALALRYVYTDEPVDALVQVASLALLKAIDRFDPERGSHFTAFAGPTILGELKRHFRDHGWAVRVPRGLQEMAQAVSRQSDTLSKELGRSPTAAEVAGAMGVSLETVLEAQEAATSYEAASLDAPVTPADEAQAPLVELIGEEETGYDLVEQRDAIASNWRSLPSLERQVLELRFVDGLSQREIGDRVGYSQMHVSRVLRRSLRALEGEGSAA